MIVVSDTSPIYYLVQIGHVDLLPELYGDVLIPPAVLDELGHPGAPSHAWTRCLPPWIRVVAPRVVDPSLKLDRGEREAISLALEVQADRLLIDEKLGRKAAQDRGLRVAGTLGVLLDAATAGILDFELAIGRLGQTTFYLTGKLVEQLRKELARRKGR